MATLFHLIFEIIRITILSAIYGLIIWYILNKLFGQKRLKKEVVIAILFVGLFVWRFSYWRNNGLGDFGRVPINSEYEITMIDFWYANIEKEGSQEHGQGLTNGIEKLYLENGLVYGQFNSKYLIFDSFSGELTDGLSKQEFEKENGNLDKLVTPDKFHGDYWGWKILLY